MSDHHLKPGDLVHWKEESQPYENYRSSFEDQIGLIIDITSKTSTLWWSDKGKELIDKAVVLWDTGAIFTCRCESIERLDPEVTHQLSTHAARPL